MEEHIMSIPEVIIVAVLAVVGYLLQRRDDQQEKQITDLYRKHEDDAARLAELDVKVAANYQRRDESIQLLREIRAEFNAGFGEITKRLDNLIDKTSK